VSRWNETRINEIFGSLIRRLSTGFLLASVRFCGTYSVSARFMVVSELKFNRPFCVPSKGDLPIACLLPADLALLEEPINTLSQLVVSGAFCLFCA
jgi:hypothetical protein